jgi:YaiO family outer membrane protein
MALRKRLCGLVVASVLAAAVRAGPWEDALAAKSAGDYPRAIALLREITGREPHNAQALFQLGTVLGWTHQFDESIAVFQRGLSIAPANLDLRLGYGRVLAWSGHLEPAEQEIRSVLAEAPANVEATIMLARLRAWRRDYDAADAAYRSVLAHTPRQVDALVGLGDLQRWQERYPEALAFYREAEQADPQSAELKQKIAALRGLGRWRLDAGVEGSTFEGHERSDWSGWDASLRYSVDRRTGVSLGGEWARRFGRDDTQYHVGVDRRFSDRVGGYAIASVTPGAEFLARRSLAAGATWKVHDGTVRWPTLLLLGDVRFATYGDHTANTFWLGATQSLPHRLALTVRAGASRNLNGHWTDGWQTRLEGDPTERCHWYAGYADGHESLSSTIYDFIRRQRTQALMFGIYYEIDPSLGVRIDYAHEWTQPAPTRNGCHVGLVRRF